MIMEEKRKKSLLRYIAVMFVVAFVLVLVSLVGQTRSIGHLSESSASALQRAEELQTTNRELTEQLDEAVREKETLQEENAELTDEIQAKTEEINALQEEIEALKQQLQTMKEGNEQ